MEMKMESFNGAVQWWSDLGVEDSASVKHLDSLFSPVAEQYTSMLGCLNNIDNDVTTSIANLQSRECHKAPTTGSVSSYLSHKHLDPSVNYERPQKMPKLNSCDGTFGQQFYGNCTPAVSASCFVQDSQPFLLQPQHQITASELDGLLASLPQVREETYSMAPGSPTFQVDMGISSLSSRQESCITDVHSAGTTAIKEIPLSPTESIRSGKGSGYIPINKMGVSVKYPAPPAKASSNAQDHIMAERKRREKLTQRFIALSAIVPGLKKMDKASVLGDAIKYVKQLQERLKELEEQTPKRASIAIFNAKQSAPSCKSSEGSPEDAAADTCEGSSEDVQQPQIEVRVIGKNVLIRVHCEKRKGVLVKALTELEKLQLGVVNANILSFSETTLDLTFSAQMEEGCELTANDVVEALQSFFKKI